MATLTKDQVRKFYDKDTYLKYNPDLAKLNMTDDQLFDHYNTYGINEDRIATPIYIRKDYAANNGDLINFAAKSNWTGSDYLNHYINYGINENRTASHMFFAPFYLAQNSDLNTAFGADASFYTLAKHYLDHGRKEAFRAGTYVDSPRNTDYTGLNIAPLSAGSANPTPIVLNGDNDYYVGTAQDDVFTSTYMNGLPTISSSTIIDGKGGYNTLNVRAVSGNLTPNLKNIEKVSLRTVGNTTFDASRSPNLSDVEFSGNNVNTVNNLSPISTTANFSINNAYNNAQSFIYAGGTPVKNAFLKLSNVMGTVLIGETSTPTKNPTNIVINSTGSSNAVALTKGSSSEYKSIVVNGDADLDLGAAAFTQVTNLDSSGLNAVLRANISTNSAVSIKTGASNDVITRTSMNAGDTIDLGAGDNTLNTNSASVGTFSTSGVTPFTNVTSLNVSDSLGADVDLSKFNGIKNFALQAGAGNGRAINNITPDNLIKLGGATVAATGPSNILKLNVGNGSTAANLNLDLTSANNYYIGTNVTNLNVQADAAAAIELTDAVANTLKTINVKGAGSADFALGGDSLPTSVKTVDATKLAGNFKVNADSGAVDMVIKGSLSGSNNITDGLKNDIITGGNGTSDIFITNTGLDKFTGNGGANSYRIGKASITTYNDANTPTNKVTVTDFNAGTNTTQIDYLNFSVAGFTQTQTLLKNGGAAAAGIAIISDTSSSHTLISNSNLVFFKDAAYANAAGLQTALQGSGALTFTSTGVGGAGAFLVAYKNTTDNCIDIALAKVGASTTTTAAATVQDIVSLQGVTDWSNLDAGDFAFIA